MKRLLNQDKLDSLIQQHTSDSRIDKYMNQAILKSYHKFNEELDRSEEDLFIGVAEASKSANSIGKGLFQFIGSNLHTIRIPSKEFLDEREKAISKAVEAKEVSKKEGKKLLSELKFLRELTGTAFVMPTSKGDSKVGVTYGFSQDLYNDISKHFPSGSKEFNDAVAAVMYHEILGHVSAGDVDPNGWNEKGENISQSGYNILYDLRINSTGIRNHVEPFKALTTALPRIVQASTLRQHLGVFYGMIDAVKGLEIRNKEFNRKNVKEYLLQKGFITKEDVVDKIFDNKEFNPKKFVSNVKKDWDKITSIIQDSYKKETSKLHLDLPEAQSVDIGKLFHILRDNFGKFEQGKADYMLQDTLLKSLDEIIKYFPKDSSSSEGTLEKEIDFSNIDSDLFDDIADDDYKAQTDNIKENINKAKDKIDKDNYKVGKGSSNVNEKLDYNPMEKLKNRIQYLLRDLDSELLTRKESEVRHLPIVPAAIVEGIQQETGRPVKVMPIGDVARQTVEKPYDGFVFFVVDESSSMSSKDIAKVKSSVMEACLSSNVGYLEFGVADKAEDASVKPLNPQKGIPKKEVKRTREGGTDQFHHIGYEFDKLMKNLKFRKNVEKALKEFNISPEELVELWKQGKVKTFVLTDGYVDTAKSKPSYREHASKMNKGTPLTYLTIRNKNAKPLDDASLYDIYHFDLSRS